MKFTSKIAEEYERLFYSAQIKPSLRAGIDSVCAQIVEKKSKYEAVSQATGVPAYFVACVHLLEAGLDFTKHLHNGDPLTARTVQVPAGRPKVGTPPFTWEQSAIDAMQYEIPQGWTDWSLGGMLYRLEAYNGFGYRRYGINTPYLWSGTQHYTKGKFVRDGVYDPNAVSKQLGIACIVLRLAELYGSKQQPEVQPQPATFAPVQFGECGLRTVALQRALNTIPGIALHEDGVAGRKTSDAYRRVFNAYLPGDPQATQQGGL